ncbi:MAG: hypothetical protein K1X68_09035 [Saprospiraceae bacterium]|nr:hypothetical protein [Saprospiraceae bacterium]HMW38631.1 hypothetical protein [Saprospiraceae bacterium]HMX86894.1 hypothetical protein [Saprospiraceae bacterium]HMZ38998.1 hypothetical protein [Saprospiraceae bacterium]HNA64812.1 hypothetical protein [Saprospiraceae bacterium]
MLQNLNDDYKERISELAGLIQNSDELAQYLDDESPESYKVLQETYEPLIAEIYQEVAEHHPLQLMELEKVILNPAFEGLFLPRILGYSVLRGTYSEENMKYNRPQDHFKDIVLAIAESANFDVIKQRIGQTIQVGFALSSDIWIASLLDRIENKKVKAFFQSMRNVRLNDMQERSNMLHRYSNQFSHYNFYCAHFPQTVSELQVEEQSLKNFLLKRIAFRCKHDSYTAELHKLMSNSSLYQEPEFVDLLCIVANFIELGQQEDAHLAKVLNDVRKSNPQFNQLYFSFLKKNYREGMRFGSVTDLRFASMLDSSIQDDLSRYYKLMETIHHKGFVHEDSLDAVNAFYAQYEGMSQINECLRMMIAEEFRHVVENLTEGEYLSFFDLSRTFGAYMNIFDNSAFNQELESMGMNYISKLLAFYKDKRSKEYQDVKKFVSSTFTEFEFLTEKEVVDLFKIKRKKKD